MNAKVELNEVDVQLYLAGALPWSKSLLFLLALMVDSDLRERVRAVREANARYRSAEMARLRKRLYPRDAASGVQGYRRNRRVTLAFGMLTLLALCALPIFRPAPPRSDADFTPKGRGLGISLFIKGDSSYRVETHTVRVNPADTLQVLPLGSEPQQLVLLGWDPRQGLVRLFPKEGAYSRRVSRGEPPPALLLQGLEDNRLICVTATSPFRMESVEALLRRRPFAPLDHAPATRLENGLFVQIYTVAKGDGI